MTTTLAPLATAGYDRTKTKVADIVKQLEDGSLKVA